MLHLKHARDRCIVPPMLHLKPARDRCILPLCIVQDHQDHQASGSERSLCSRAVRRHLHACWHYWHPIVSRSQVDVKRQLHEPASNTYTSRTKDKGAALNITVMWQQTFAVTPSGNEATAACLAVPCLNLYVRTRPSAPSLVVWASALYVQPGLQHLPARAAARRLQRPQQCVQVHIARQAAY
jgi:hypothetical protein